MSKKRFCKYCALPFVVIMLMTNVVNASSSNTVVEENIAVWGELNEEDYAEENLRLMKLGASLTSNARVSAQKVLSIPRLAQANPSWGNVVMQYQRRTIAEAGCYLTSFTMVQRYYGGEVLIPVELIP